MGEREAAADSGVLSGNQGNVQPWASRVGAGQHLAEQRDHNDQIKALLNGRDDALQRHVERHIGLRPRLERRGRRQGLRLPHLVSANRSWRKKGRCHLWIKDEKENPKKEEPQINYIYKKN